MGNFRRLGTWTALICLGGSACAPAPEAGPMTATVPQRGVATIVVVPGLGPPGEIEVASVSQPANGLAQIGAPGTVVYVPSITFTGEDRFTYTLQNRAGRMATGTVTVTVLPVNDPPEARHDLFTITRPASLEGARLDVLRNDSDYNGDALRVVRASNGARGTVTIVEDGAAVVYRALERFRDVDTFEYTITDGEHEVTTWVVVQVTAPDHDPAPTPARSRS